MSENEQSLSDYLTSISFTQISTYGFIGDYASDVGRKDILKFGKPKRFQLEDHASLITTLDAAGQDALDILGSLRREQGEISNWMCAPIYRDALVFENLEADGTATKTGLIGVCFTCFAMTGTARQYFEADMQTYLDIRGKMMSLGHAYEYAGN